MTEFAKLKIGFALALLGTLFALHPLLDRSPDLGFVYLGYRLQVAHAYALTSGLLGLCVYLYAVTLLNDHPHSWGERSGNSVYALAILVLPIYAGLFLSASLAEKVALTHVAWAAPAVAIGLGSGWIVLSQVVAWRIRRRFGEQDRVSKMEQLARQEAQSIDRARELFASDHYDLSVVEAWRALEARLRQALLSRRVATTAGDPQAVIRVAVKKGLLKEPTLGLVAELKRHWLVAVSTEPLPREAAIESLGAVRYILSILPARETPPHRAGEVVAPPVGPRRDLRIPAKA
jgi:HEPN domain-containing protein